jgi:hypothetical protein
MEVYGQFHAPATSHLSKELMLPIGWDGLQSWFGQSVEEKNLLPLQQIEPKFLTCQACSVVTVKILYHGFWLLGGIFCKSCYASD